LVGRTTIVPSIPTNALIIRTAPPNYPLLRETIEALDARPPQVLFEVTVAEVALGRGEEFGVNWSAIGRDAGVRVGDPDVDDATSGRQDFALRVSSLNDIDVRAVLRAIASRTNVRVLSTPEILAANNREARILVGSRVPFISSTRLGNDVAIDRAVQYQDVGTTLTIVPTVNQDDYVSVRILQEVSSLTTQTVSAALNAPIISTREATTRAIIRNGQTVVIGGLIGSAQEQSESGVPLLKDLPLLGALFKRQARSNSRTEIAIFVTPRVIRTDAEADALRERSQQRLDGVAPGVLTPPARRPPNTP
jgi:general secretion pathway protein D